MTNRQQLRNLQCRLQAVATAIDYLTRVVDELAIEAGEHELKCSARPFVYKPDYSAQTIPSCACRVSDFYANIKKDA